MDNSNVKGNFFLKDEKEQQPNKIYFLNWIFMEIGWKYLWKIG